MVRIPRVLIAGGYGVFGRLLAAELLRTTPAEIVIAGRDPTKAARACRDLDGSWQRRVEPMAIDLSRPGELRRAAEGCLAVVCTAGPFQGLSAGIVDEVVQAGAHWVDIADASDWVLGILEDSELGERARAGGVAVGTGLSTVPALSGVLAGALLERVPGATTARVVLSIGNRNRKGAASIASALFGGMRERARVETPLGPRLAYRIDAPDERLLADERLETTCWVALESSIARRVAVVARSRSTNRSSEELMGRARFLSRISSLWSPGTRGGCVHVELLDDRGSGAAAAFVGSDQRMAILPAAIVVERLMEGSAQLRATVRPVDWMPTTDWIDELRRREIQALGKEISESPLLGSGTFS
jgi:hypothetical protein